MGRVYSVTFEGVAVTAAQDFFEIIPASNKAISLIGFMLSQSSDTGDAAEEILRIKIIRGHATTGSGGSVATPRPVNSSADTAAGAIAEINNTTIASTGTAVDLFAHAFNIRAGLEHYFPPECRPSANSGDGTIVVRLMAAPADSLTMSGTLFFEELM
jgi:hypothetical protein